jgi:hypothetical protein
MERILSNLNQTDISDYHRLLAAITLRPLLVQPHPLLQAVLERNLDPVAVEEFQDIPKSAFFDEAPAPFTDFEVEGFVKTAGKK